MGTMFRPQTRAEGPHLINSSEDRGEARMKKQAHRCHAVPWVAQQLLVESAGAKAVSCSFSGCCGPEHGEDVECGVGVQAGPGLCSLFPAWCLAQVAW